jgi:hypothetical protein
MGVWNHNQHLYAQDDHFSQIIRPILSDKCFSCHGPDSAHREADLRLDIREEALKNGAIVPGKPEASSMVERILSTDPDTMMPPEKSHRILTAKEKELLQKWIADGAPYAEHWAFTKVKLPVVPDNAQSTWPQNSIDQFILEQLSQNKLQPAPPASKSDLIRRVTFDLTGLPPTLEEHDVFLADQSPDAFEKVVDRLLASPHYGERMAIDWLDAARYSDSYGYQVDKDRFVWPWRDWVIRSFNDNLPYDQFITWQLAGDMLPQATPDQILATTFCRLNPQEAEGGSVVEEYRIEYVADRTHTFGTAFMGLTLECCRCHDHKFDPLSHKEYYQFSAFFNNIDEAGLYSYFTDAIPTPTLELPTDSQCVQQQQLETQLRQLEQKSQQFITERHWEKDFQQWLNADTLTLPSIDPAKPQGLIFKSEFEAEVKSPNQQVPGKHGQAVELTGDDGIEISKIGNFKREDPFSITMWIQIPDHKERAVICHRSRAWTDAASRGYEIMLEDGKLTASLIHFWPGNAIKISTIDPLPLKTWLHVTMTSDGSSLAEGLKLYINGESIPTDIIRNELTRTIQGGGGDSITIGERFRDSGFKHGLVDDFCVYDRELTAIEAYQFAHDLSLLEAIKHVQSTNNKLNQDQLEAYYLAQISPEAMAVRIEIQSVRAQLNELQDHIAEIMVMQEMPAHRPTFILARGVYDAPTDPVSAAFPNVFMKSSSTATGSEKKGINRLDLAHWLISRDHPLTSRVAINRLWQQMFGVGLVKTAEDFGNQGTPPTHPQLMNWLASDFMDHDWDVKRLLKLIAMSATYQQSSRENYPEVITSLKLDPENKLLSRGSSRRLTAEMLRDQLLYLSGLSQEQLFGPPVKPYELEESFKPTPRDKGSALYRRSIYTYFRRTSAPPVMMALDANGRDVCKLRRNTTSSPIQTLILFNGPEFVEGARKLAQQIILQHSDANDEKLTERIFQSLTGRPPEAKESAILLELVRTEQKRFSDHPADRDLYLSIGDSKVPDTINREQLATFTVLAQTIFNYQETITIP